jgi:nucleoid-associated protein YgaU
MPNDAKLGLVVGVLLVIAVAVAFFRKDAPAADQSATSNVQAVADNPADAPAAAAPQSKQLPVQPGIRQTSGPAEADGRCHTVKDGETLFSLAQRYYGDGEKSEFLYRSNFKRIPSRDSLPAGTVLVIPELPKDER